MAAPTTSTTSTGAEPRALGAALDASTPFVTRGGVSALGAADAHLRRWGLAAPGAAASTDAPRGRAGGGAMSALSFADARLASWMAASEGAGGLRSLRAMMGYARDGFATRNIPMVSWLMPRPAYLDDLAWLAEARAMRTARPVAAAAGVAAMPLHLVAPDLASDLAGNRAAGSEASEAIQAWAPSVSATQLDAAGVLALGTTMLASRALAAGPATAPGMPAHHRASGMALTSRVVAGVARTIATSAAGPARAAALADVASNLRAFVQATDGMIGARATLQPAQNVSDVSDGTDASVTSLPTAAVLMLRAAERGQAPALVAGPPMLQPAGLGGALVASRDAVRVEQLRSRTAVIPASTIASPSATTGTLAAMATTPAALRHVAWADRWLGRVGGASDGTLDAFTRAVALPAARGPGAAMTLLQAVPTPAAAASNDPAFRGAVAAPSGAIADDDVTPDAVLMAIAAARGRGPQRARLEPAPAVAAARTTPVAPSAIDARLAQPMSLASDAGLAVALAASPMAVALRGITGNGSGSALTMPGAASGSRVADVRMLMPSQVAAAYLATAASMDRTPLAGAPVDRPALGWQPLFLDTTRTFDAAEPSGAPSVAGGAHRASVSRGRPGDLAVAATVLAHATEQTAGDLAFDFVRPETVIVARGYGLSVQDAAVAERLALVGPARLGATAAALEHTLVRQLLAASATRGDEVEPGVAATAGTRRAGAGGDDVASALVPPAAGAGALDMPVVGGGAAASVAGELERDTAPEDDRDVGGAADGAWLRQRTRGAALPRGAFLWPAAAVAALGLERNAAAASAPQLLVALELLAARAVADLGVQVMPRLAATGTADVAAPASRIVGAAGFDHVALGAGAELPDASMTGLAERLAPANDAVGAVGLARRGALPSPLYVALAEHARDGATGPLAPTAARAMALAARDGVATSARARAQLAWSVLPVVHVGLDGASPTSTTRAGDAERAGMHPDDALVQLDRPGLDAGDDEGGASTAGRPTLRGIPARAGAALRSYVGPERFPEQLDMVAGRGAAAASPRTDTLRAPSAAPELVRTGPLGPRYGGGEVEIPGWFEAAARKMLEQRSPGSDFSVADLTLVAAAPSTQIAASSKQTSVSASSTGSGQSASSVTRGVAASPDIERLARDVYDQFMQLIDVARWRNYGDR